VSEKKLGKKIKQIRNSLGLSQMDLAEKIGVSFQQIQKYEKGATKISVLRLQQISEALGIPIFSFFETSATPTVSESQISYSTSAKSSEQTFPPLLGDELSLLKLFRKIENPKLKEGVIKQIRGVLEIENAAKSCKK